MKKEKPKKKIFKIIISLCVIVLLVDVIFVLYKQYQSDLNKTYFDSLNAFEKINAGYIAVGSNNNNNKSYEKGKITEYNKAKEKVWEKFYNKGYNSTFINVKEDKGNFLVVGSYERTKGEKKDKTRTALFIKYDKDGNEVFEKHLQILGNSKFVNVVPVNDGYIVVGQSIFENMTLGVDSRGGGIMIKYDKSGKELWRTNYGGSKSGLFNDLIVTNNYIYVVGKDAGRVGTLSKYSLDGKRISTINYEYTDTLGFSSIARVGNQLIVVGAKKMKEDQNDFDIDGLIVKYDLDCDQLDEVTYRGKGMERFNKIIVDKDNNLVLIGHTGVKDNKKSTKSLNVFSYNGLIAKYKKSLSKVYVLEYGDNRDDYFTDVEEVDNNYLVSGYSSYRKDGFLAKFITYSKQGKVLGVK